MASTFMGLNIGKSALATFQTAVNTTANNISNVRTAGYTRQTTEINATAALRVNAKYGSVGTGVEATAIKQTRNEYYDTKYWENSSSFGLYEQKLYYLDQIQTILKDDASQTGFSTIFANMFRALDSVITDGPGDLSTRNQFINKAQSLCTYFNSVYVSLRDIQEDCNQEIKTSVDSINAMSEKLALLNREIYNLEVRGGYANELRDERNVLLDQLSSMVKVETNEVNVYNTNGEDLGVTTYRIYINGQTLVDGFEHRSLEVTSSSYQKNQCDIDGMYSVVWSDTKMNFAVSGATAGGSLKALFAMRDGNNADPEKGKITAVDALSVPKTITVEELSVTQLEALAIADKGTLSIGNTTYYYEGFDIEMSEPGTISKLTFRLTGDNPEHNVTAGKLGALVDKGVTVGESVDAMGVPYYMTQMNQFIRVFAKAFNDIEKTGQTLDGDEMGAFFTAKSVTGNHYDFSDQQDVTNYGGQTTATFDHYDSTYFLLTAGTFEVNELSLRNARYFSTTKDITNGIDAYDIITKLETLQKGVTMFRGDDAESFLETLLSDISVDTNKTEIFCNNYGNLSSSLENQRTSVSGVDEDEEALDLIRFQNAYNLASKMISVMSELYNKLINETGV